MRTMGRRGFLSGAFLGHSAVPAAAAEGDSPDRPRLVHIGGIADFPIGGIRTLPEGGVLVESLPEGLRARSLEDGGPHFAINAGQNGGLVVDRARIWPANRVYSVLTNEPADISASWEEQT